MSISGKDFILKWVFFKMSVIEKQQQQQQQPEKQKQKQKHIYFSSHMEGIA